MLKSVEHHIQDDRRLRAVESMRTDRAEASDAAARLVRVAARALHCRFVLFTLVSDAGIHLEAAHGIPETTFRGRQLPLRESPCVEVISTGKPAMLSDPNGIRNPYADILPGKPVIRSVLSVPLRTRENQVVGALTLIDSDPRDWTGDDVRFIEDLVTGLMREFELRSRSEAVEQESDTLHSVFESVGEGIYGIDRDGNCSFANRSALSMLGYEPDEIVGKKVHTLIHHHRTDGSAYPPDECPMNRVLREKRGLRAEGETLWTKKGTPLEVDLLMYPFGDGEKGGAVVTFIPVSMRKRNVDLMRQQIAAMEVSLDGIAMIDNNSRLIYANPAYARIHGYEPEEIIGKSADAMSTPQEIDRLRREVGPALWKSGHWRGEAEGRHRNGHMIPLEVSVVLIGNRASVVNVRDLTEAKRAERERRLLERAGSMFAESLDIEKTLETIASLVVPEVADWCTLLLFNGGEGRFIARHSDPARTAEAEGVLKTSPPPELRANSAAWKKLYSGLEVLKTVVDEEFLNDAIWSDEVRAFCLKNRIRSLMIIPLKARDRVFGAIAFVTTEESGRSYCEGQVDLIRHLAARAALALDNARLYAEAQQSARVREELLAVVSHELKNPLGAIMMGAGFLCRSYENLSGAQITKQLETIRAATHRMDRLIRDLLDLAKIQAGHVALESTDCESQTLLREAASLLETLSSAKGIKIAVNAPPSGLRVYCDHDRVIQVLTNLIGNSVKFSPPGTKIELIAERLDEREIRFCVADGGPGIAADQLPYLFTRFWQARPTAKLGSGLGLSISKGIIESHGGRIWATSDVGKGSQFYFTLPASPNAPRRT